MHLVSRATTSINICELIPPFLRHTKRVVLRLGFPLHHHHEKKNQTWLSYPFLAVANWNKKTHLCSTQFIWTQVVVGKRLRKIPILFLRNISLEPEDRTNIHCFVPPYHLQKKQLLSFFYKIKKLENYMKFITANKPSEHFKNPGKINDFATSCCCWTWECCLEPKLTKSLNTKRYTSISFVKI